MSDIRHRKLKKIRTLEIGERDIKPFTCGKPKIKTFKFNLTETVEPDNLLQCKRRDIAWMVSCASIDTTPMWHGGHFLGVNTGQSGTHVIWCQVC